MGRALYWLVEWVDETYLQHRFWRLCAWQDRHTPHGPHKPSTPLYLAVVLIVLALLGIVTWKE